jgi:hypothetical protein
MQYQFVSSQRIISKVIRDYALNEDEGDIIEWIGEALGFIGAAATYEEAVSFVEVSNYKALLPQGLHRIIQIARNNKWVKQDKSTICLVADNTTNAIVNVEPYTPIHIDDLGRPIEDYDEAYYRPFYDLKWEYTGWMDSTVYHRFAFTPVRLATSSMFNNLVCQETCVDYCNARDQYSIIGRGSVIKTSFQEGQIAVACLRQIVDEDGYPMVPDDTSYTEAIARYINYRVQCKEFYAGREGANLRMNDADAKWQWYCSQAATGAMMPSVDELENMTQGQYLIPRQNEYASFFGNLGVAEDRSYLRSHPNRNRYIIHGR